MEKISGSVSFGWVWWVWWVRVGDGSIVSGSVVGVMSYQKIFGLYGLEGHIVEKMWDATPVRNEPTNERR